MSGLTNEKRPSSRMVGWAKRQQLVCISICYDLMGTGGIMSGFCVRKALHVRNPNRDFLRLFIPFSWRIRGSSGEKGAQFTVGKGKRRGRFKKHRQLFKNDKRMTVFLYATSYYITRPIKSSLCVHVRSNSVAD